MDAARKIDSRGRLLLGEEFAGQHVLIEERPNGELVIKPAVVIPAREQWLYKNPKALASVRRGLEQARNKESVANPDFDKVSSWIDELED